MKEKLGAIVAVLLIMALFTGIISEWKDKRADHTVSEETVSEEPSVDTYSYNDIEYLMLYLSSDSSMQEEISRLVDPLEKSGSVTLGYVKQVLEIIGADESVIAEESKDLEEDEVLSREAFDEIYDRIVSSGIVENLRKDSVFVYEVEQTGASLETMVTISDGKNRFMMDEEALTGVYGESQNLWEEFATAYEDKILDVYKKDDIIIRINGYSDQSFTLENAWMVENTDNKCTFLYDGLQKTYLYTGNGTNAQKGSVVSFVVTNEGISEIMSAGEVLEGQVMSVTDEGIRLKGHGIYPYNENFRIYDNYRDIRCEESIQILTGYAKLKLVVSQGVAQAAIIDSELYSDSVRVILSDEDFDSYEKEEAVITCNTAFELSYPDGSTAVYEAEETVKIDCHDYKNGDKITVKPREYEGRLKMLSLLRECGNPDYRGVLEFDIKEGYMYVINELPLEEYLYSVVASEMPAESPEEALKAMAICARGYAYSKMNDESYSDYDAHLDDSSLCQVYNNVGETEETIRAVRDTYGIVPTYENEVIVPLYFSTSCGVTCTNDEIWGGTAYPYLESNLETLEKESVDLSLEEDFKQFISDSMGKNMIDSEMPYYRWSISFTDNEMTDAVLATLHDRMEISADYIKIQDEKGNFVSGAIDDIGDVTDVRVKERSTSGVVQKLEISGTKATIEVSGQSNIRNLITPVNQSIVRQDGSAVTGWTSLPSPYYYVEKKEGGFVLYGGGFGHGVGMSQNGARVLAEQGYNYKYILRHYYSFIDFSSIYTIGEAEE